MFLPQKKQDKKKQVKKEDIIKGYLLQHHHLFCLWPMPVIDFFFCIIQWFVFALNRCHQKNGADKHSNQDSVNIFCNRQYKDDYHTG